VTKVNGTAINNNDTVTLTNGSLQFIAPGQFNFTPNAGFVGTQTFTYEVSDQNGGTSTATVTINVAAGNSPPVATDDSYTITEFNTLTTVVGGSPAGVLDNDTDPDGDTLTAILLTSPSNGTAVLLADGKLTYTPNDGFTGVETFSYRVIDGNGGVDVGTITINVQANTNPGPKVTDVHVKSTAWDPLFTDFVEDFAIDSDTKGYNVSAAADPTKPLSWINLNQIVVTFDTDVGASLDRNDFVLEGIAGVRADLTPGQIPQIIDVAVDTSGLFATLTLSGSLDASKLTLRVLSNGVFDSAGNRLDGDSSGQAGGDYAFSFNVLPGDIDQDGDVD
ncbi:MAG: tandem-95 repeat protein, partial [Candidatus Zixiibacteriota bacterium]